MHPLMTIAIRAARSAGNIISRHANELDNLNVEQKSRNDFVSEVDKLAESEIIDTIKKAYPDHAILAEESGQHGDSDHVWMIDPLDGTTNFLHGYPQYAVSIACKIRNHIEIAVVYNPATDELFTAERGRGAMLNNKRIRVSPRPNLDGALIATGIPFSPDRDFDAYLDVLRKFMGRPAGIRRGGAAALDLAYVAAGRVDGYWEGMLKPWDVAAGILLVQEAGGLVSDFENNKDYLSNGNIVAGNPKMHADIMAQLKGYVPNAQ